MANITHTLTLGFNGDTVEMNADFHSNNVHIIIKSRQLGTIEESTANAKDYSHLLDASPSELDAYIITQLAFYAYALAEKVEEFKA